MAVGRGQEGKMAPVHFFSHGSTMMLGEEHNSAKYWERMGDLALENGLEHVIMMGAHWATTSEAIQISSNPNPGKSPVAFVHPSKYTSYTLTPDPPMLPVIQSHLTAAGIPSHAADPALDWVHDVYLVLIRMFPRGCPPTTILSSQHRYDPHLHASVGAALRPLRDWAAHRTLFIGSGGAVHNLYRNVWGPMVRYRDNFAQVAPPGAWAMDFRQEVVDALVAGGSAGLAVEDAACGAVLRSGEGVGGPGLRRRVAALMRHPRYREAHATDDHFMACLFVAGLCAGVEDEDMRGELGAEDWELTNMCNSQFTIGSWDE